MNNNYPPQIQGQAFYPPQWSHQDKGITMSECRNVVPEKTDHVDYGPMGDFDDPHKPVCDCSNSLVTSIGNDIKWEWSCVNCSKTFAP